MYPRYVVQKDAVHRFFVGPTSCTTQVPMVLLAVIAATDDQGRDLHGRGFRMEPYGGPLQYMYLSMFLLQRAEALGYVLQHASGVVCMVYYVACSVNSFHCVAKQYAPYTTV